MSAGDAMRLKWVQDAEASLRPAHLETWKIVHARLPVGRASVGADYGLEIYLLSQIQRGATVEMLDKFIPKPQYARGPERRQEPDRRMLQAGDV